MAQTYIALAQRHAYCDGFPYHYKSAVVEADHLTNKINNNW
jgi:hypothetical protein